MKEKDKDNKESEGPVVSKKPTREDLQKAAEAARDAAGAVAAAMSPPTVMVVGTERPGESRRRTPTGPGAEATGHGNLFVGFRPKDGPAAFEQFMAALRDPLRKAGGKVRVTDNAGWIKIEGMQGHKVYIAKTKTGTSRVESTLDPDLIKGAKSPDKKNGRIASWLPADPEVVAEAIGLLATLTEPIRPPARGVAENDGETE